MIPFAEAIKRIKGKTIALVYIFEGEDATGFDHFLTWRDHIISGWLKAIYEIQCVPYIVDVRTFIQKASNYTLPHIDYVINLNSGCYQLSTMSLIPSVCSFLGIPCIPCDAVSIVTTENKMLSNYIAKGFGITIPQKIQNTNEKGIFRPINLGNSIGVKVGIFDKTDDTGIYQEFIPGFDVTIPFAYNYYTKSVDILPPIMYIPNSLNPNWFYDEKTKEQDSDLTTAAFLEIDREAKEQITGLIGIFGIKTYGRIDARLRYNEKVLSKEIVNNPFTLKDLFFIEINSMPTVESEDGLDLSYNAVLHNSNHSFYQHVNEYVNLIENASINGFLLSSSIMALTSKY